MRFKKSPADNNRFATEKFFWGLDCFYSPPSPVLSNTCAYFSLLDTRIYHLFKQPQIPPYLPVPSLYNHPPITHFTLAMAGLFDLEQHLVFYRSYHFNKVNVTIHLICIPIILLSAITFLLPTNVLGSNHPHINLGSILAWGYGTYYVLLDRNVGLPSFAVLTSFAYFVKNYYMSLSEFTEPTRGQFIKYAIFLHIGAWLAQFYGHGVHEKRAPALLDNLLQALVLAPFFVAFEIAFALGYRTDLKKSMDNQAGVRIRNFIAQSKAKNGAKSS